MHISKVKGNVKKGCDVEIGPKTLIVGPNGSGKSTVVNTVELALTGRVSDVAGRVDIAREADVMSLAKDGAGDLSAIVTFDDGVAAAYHTVGSTAKAKKATGDRPAGRCHDEVLPVRTLKENVLGSPQTARKYLMSKVSTATYDDVKVLIPTALSNRFAECFPANVPISDALVAAVEYAAKRQRECNSEAKTAREAGKLVAGGRGSPPSEADVKAAQAALKVARDALKAVEAAESAAEELRKAEVNVATVEAHADKVAVKLTNARTALNDAKKPKALNPLLSHVCFVMDESVLAGECLCCGGTPPTKAMANEVSEAIADTVSANAAYEKLAAAVAAYEGEAKAALEILEKAEGVVASLKAKSLVETIDPEVIEKEVAEAEAKVVELKSARDAWASVQKAESTALDAERQAVEWKALKEALEHAMGATIDASLAAFVAKVQSFLPKSDTFGMKLRDGEREVVSFGLVRDGHLHTALSGAEWARVIAAMSSACVPAGKYACVVPEERAFDPATLKDVMVALSDCPHQVILTSPVKPKSVPKGWVLVERGE